MEELSDEDAVGGSSEATELLTKRIAQHTHLLTFRNLSTERESTVDDAAFGCPDPASRGGETSWTRSWCELLGHAKSMEDTEDAVDSRLDRSFIEPVSLTSLEYQAGRSRFGGRTP